MEFDDKNDFPLIQCWCRFDWWRRGASCW